MSYSIRLPISALIFYSFLLLLIYFSIIPSLPKIYQLLKELFLVFGLNGLFIASFLEGLVYIGLYFPGSLIIVLAVIFSKGSFLELFMISFIVAMALTLSSTINYFFGKYSFLNKYLKPLNKQNSKQKLSKKSFFLSFLHPNALGFYFYTLGAKNKSFRKILFVPIIMIPYGFGLAFLFYIIKDTLKEQIENSYIIITIIIIWLIIAILFNYYNLKEKVKIQ